MLIWSFGALIPRAHQALRGLGLGMRSQTSKSLRGLASEVEPNPDLPQPPKSYT